jgi:glycosyltransferase involved in cell wall biosynthesis
MPGQNPPLISIVIPCYNYGRFLSETITSVLAQTYQPLEIIVVDDGSTDDSHAVAAGFASRGVKYHYQPNQKLSGARNTGTQLSHGQFIMFLDADDILEPTYVSECYQALHDHPEAGFAYTQMRLFGREDGVTTVPEYSRAELLLHNYIHASALMRSELARQYPYNASLRTGWEDWDLYLTFAEHNVAGVLVDKPLLRYRKHDNDASMVDAIRRNNKKQRQLRQRIMKLHPQLFTPMVRVRSWRKHYRPIVRERIKRLLGSRLSETVRKRL